MGHAMTYIAEPYTITPYAASDFNPPLPGPATITMSDRAAFSLGMDDRPAFTIAMSDRA